MKKIYSTRFNRSRSSSTGAGAGSIRSSSMVADADADECVMEEEEAERKNSSKIRMVEKSQPHPWKVEEEAEKRRNIEVRLISAQDLRRSKVEMLPGHGMRAYAVAYVDADHKAQTRVEEEKGGGGGGGGNQPVWNEVLTISVAESALRSDSLACLTVDILSRRPRGITRLLPDRLVGTVRIFLSDVVKLSDDGHDHNHDVVRTYGVNPIRCMAFWVRLPSGDPHGILNVWIPPTGRFLRRHITNNNNDHISSTLSPHLPLPVHHRGEEANCSFKQLLQRPAVTASLDYHHHHHHHRHRHRQILGDSCCDADTETFIFE